LPPSSTHPLTSIVIKETLKPDIDASKTTTNNRGPGVWLIERRPKATIIEIRKVEDTGYGGILSQEWLAWRHTKDPLEAAKSRLMDQL
jgi:hypothetical protein